MLTTLYRYFDTNDRLVYLGIASCHLARSAQHARHADWHPLAVRATLMHYPSRAAAMEAERVAIETERPLFNVTYNAPTLGTRRAHYKTGPRRARGTGCIRQRSDGVWAAAISRGSINGKRIRPVFYGPSEEAVRAKLDAALRESA